MRRLLKDVAEERELGDVTTLADPAIVEEIRDKAAARPRRTDPGWGDPTPGPKGPGWGGGNL